MYEFSFSDTLCDLPRSLPLSVANNTVAINVARCIASLAYGGCQLDELVAQVVARGLQVSS